MTNRIDALKKEKDKRKLKKLKFFAERGNELAKAELAKVENAETKAESSKGKSKKTVTKGGKDASSN